MLGGGTFYPPQVTCRVTKMEKKSLQSRFKLKGDDFLIKKETHEPHVIGVLTSKPVPLLIINVLIV